MGKLLVDGPLHVRRSELGTAAIRIVLAHQQPADAEALAWSLSIEGWEVTCVALNGLNSCQIAHLQPDLLLMQASPATPQICTELRRSPVTADLSIMLLDAEEAVVGALNWQAFDADSYHAASGSWNELVRQIRALLRNQQTVEAAAEAGAQALIATIQNYDLATAEHMRRVSQLAEAIGRQLGLRSAALHALRRGALLHDIGKLAVSAAILHKPEPLTPTEQHRVRQHPNIGAQIVGLLPDAARITPIVRYHHERWDGRGYPDCLGGAEIPLSARIVAVADAFDALTSPRSYHQALEPTSALSLIEAGVGRHWDSRVVTALTDCSITRPALCERAVGTAWAA